jgi:hypothetical protein
MAWLWQILFCVPSCVQGQGGGIESEENECEHDKYTLDLGSGFDNLEKEVVL